MVEKPEPRQPKIKTGMLAMPRFVGPPKPQQWRPPPKPSPWEEHFKLCRQTPGRRDNKVGWAIVSEVKGKGRVESLHTIKRDRERIRLHLERRHPLERWQLQIVTIPDSWADKQLYIRYLGELTPEEDALDRKERRARWEAMMARRDEKRAERALAARAEAIRESERLRASPARRR